MTTVVGLFDTPAQAAKVKQMLVEEGYTAANVRVLSNESDGFATAAVSDAKALSSEEQGVMGSIKNFFHSFTNPDANEQEYYTRGVSAGGALLAVTTPEEHLESVASLLETHGARNVNEEASTTGATAGKATATATTARGATGDEVIPIMEEELQVGKRQVQRGAVRVYSHVVETPVEEEVRLREEHVHVQRTPINRAASAADFQAFQEGTIELTEMGEEAVVAKQARVVEEVVIGKDVNERTQAVRDTVRHTEVDVEQVPGESVGRDASTAKR